MKFLYPYKLYAIGFLLYCIFCSFGFYNIFILGQFSIFLSITYIVLCAIPSFCYYTWYKTYKGDYVIVNQSSITIVRNDYPTNYTDDQISKLISVRQKYFVRIQDQIYIETFTGDKFCITSDINSFKKLRDLLKKRYKNKFITHTEFLHLENN